MAYSNQPVGHIMHGTYQVNYRAFFILCILLCSKLVYDISEPHILLFRRHKAHPIPFDFGGHNLNEQIHPESIDIE